MKETYKEPTNWAISAEPDFRLLVVKGEDAETFLQGQLTQDVVKLSKGKAAWAAACNYQGRVAAVSLLFRIPDGFGLMLPASLAQGEMERLQKYVLRSKVSMEIAPLDVTYICASEATAAKVKCPGLPEDDMAVYEGNSTIVIRLPRKGADGFMARYVAFGPLPQGMVPAPESKNALMSALMNLGVAFIGTDESLEWLPQALNLDLIGAVATNKGCYNGQEVINKTQSLGKVKRRMFLGKAPIENVDDDREIFVQNEPVGRIIVDNGEQFLAILRWDFWDSPLTVQSKQVSLIDLPYEVTVPGSVIK